MTQHNTLNVKLSNWQLGVRLFLFECLRNVPIETASDVPKTEVTKKNKEVKHISPSFKKHWKAYLILLQYKKLPLASYKLSFSIFHQSYPFHKLSAQVFLKWVLHVFPKHGKPYIDGILV